MESAEGATKVVKLLISASSAGIAKAGAESPCERRVFADFLRDRKAFFCLAVREDSSMLDMVARARVRIAVMGLVGMGISVSSVEGSEIESVDKSNSSFVGSGSVIVSEGGGVFLAFRRPARRWGLDFG